LKKTFFVHQHLPGEIRLICSRDLDFASWANIVSSPERRGLSYDFREKLIRKTIGIAVQLQYGVLPPNCRCCTHHMSFFVIRCEAEKHHGRRGLTPGLCWRRHARRGRFTAPQANWRQADSELPRAPELGSYAEIAGFLRDRHKKSKL
jgi:hypothetical protein